MIQRLCITLTFLNRFSGFQNEPDFQLTQNYSTSYPWRGPLLFEPCDSDHGNDTQFFRILCVSTGNLTILGQFWGHRFNIWGNFDHHRDEEIDECLGFWPHEPRRLILCDKIIESLARCPIRWPQIETGQTFSEPSQIVDGVLTHQNWDLIKTEIN